MIFGQFNFYFCPAWRSPQNLRLRRIDFSNEWGAISRSRLVSPNPLSWAEISSRNRIALQPRIVMRVISAFN